MGVAAIEGTRVFWLTLDEELEAAGIRPAPYHARDLRRVKGRKTDIADTRLATALTGYFGPSTLSFVPAW